MTVHTLQQERKRALAQTLFSLLENLRYSNLSVADICRAADDTIEGFYALFDSKHELLYFCLNALAERLIQQSAALPLSECLCMFLWHTQKHAPLYRNLLLCEQEPLLRHMFCEVFNAALNAHLWRYGSARHSREELQLKSAYYSAGMASTMLWWIEKGFPISADEMAAFQRSMLEDVLAVA